MILKFKMNCSNKKYEEGWLLYKQNKLTIQLRCDRKMHEDDLKAVWICHECRILFVFHSDVVNHKDLTGHMMIEKVMMIPSAETTG